MAANKTYIKTNPATRPQPDQSPPKAEIPFPCPRDQATLSEAELDTDVETVTVVVAAVAVAVVIGRSPKVAVAVVLVEVLLFVSNVTAVVEELVASAPEVTFLVVELT